MGKMKKIKGSSGVLDLFPVILMVVFGGYLLISFGSYIKYLDCLNELENITRKYIMIMETTNGMTVSDMNELYQELSGLGIDTRDIKLEGTTFCGEDVEYGTPIYLNLTVEVPCNVIKLMGDMSVTLNEMKQEVNIVKCTIALS